jgi:glycosyltransferase involved in cell wall biosynthesis
MIDWSVVVFAKNEKGSIESCLSAIETACSGSDSHVTVVLNGSKDGTDEAVFRYSRLCRIPINIFEIPFGDKANAWNKFIYDLRPSAHVYFFVDAYAIVGMRAFQLLAFALQKHTAANAATGVPSSGRSAAALAAEMHATGGLHGSLHALRFRFVERICESQYRLPIGLYRGDGLIGSMAMHDLNPLVHPWCPERIVVVDGATWTHRVLSPFRPRDIMRQCNRMIRQARGRLEDEAIKRIIYRYGYGGLPTFADDMIADWLSGTPSAERNRLRRQPLTWAAMMRTRRRVRPYTTELMATTLGSDEEHGGIAPVRPDRWRVGAP